MYILDGIPFDISQPQTVGEYQYPPNWFADSDQRAAHGIEPLRDTTPPTITSAQKLVVDGYMRDAEDRWVANWLVIDLTEEELAQAAAALAAAKAAKMASIDAAHNLADSSSFPYLGKQISVNALAIRKMFATSGYIGMFGELPPDWPGAWLCTDGSPIMMPVVDDFKAMYAAMYAQGLANLTHGRDLLTALAAATTLAEVAAIVW